jgi:hypothetical protein
VPNVHPRMLARVHAVEETRRHEAVTLVGRAIDGLERISQGAPPFSDTAEKLRDLRTELEAVDLESGGLLALMATISQFMTQIEGDLLMLRRTPPLTNAAPRCAER